MIKYNLHCKSSSCDNKQPFDGWFQNSKAYDEQKIGGLLTCPYCGSGNVDKSLMSPAIKDSKKTNHNASDEINKINSVKTETKNINYTADQIMTVLRTIKKEVETNADFVGNNFVDEARAIKSGHAEERPIYGNAQSEEIEELQDEGIQVSTIPWLQDDH